MAYLPLRTWSSLSFVCLITTSVMVCDAGILPSFPSLPSLPSFSNPFDGARGWYFLPDFNSFWTDLPKKATSFLTKLVPQPIKNFLNFDPAPKWVPDPEEFEEKEDNEEKEKNKEKQKIQESKEIIDSEEFEENETIIRNKTTDLSGQSSENRALRQTSKDEENFENEEKGNLHGLGRDVIRTLTNTVNDVTTGLDTDQNFFSGVLNEFKDRVKAIYPGTQWCGDGNIARTRKDLGYFRKTDRCCRQHDNCPDYIERETAKYGLHNNGLFTRSNCECDMKFYNCLKAANDMVSGQIGTAYFTVLGPQCFKKDYPKLYCRIQVGLTNRCIEYELDNTTRKIYQWFDIPEY